MTKKNKTLSHLKQTKTGKMWLYSATALAIFVGSNYLIEQVVPASQLVVKADELSDTGAVTIGKLNDKPVVKTPNNNMASDKFSSVVQALVGDNVGSVKYIANNLAWQSNTTVENSRSVPTTGVGYFMGQDGFADAHAVKVDEGGSILVKNMGTVKDLDGKVIPVDVRVNINEYSPIDNASNTTLPKTGLLVAIKGLASDGTLQLDFGAPYEGATGGAGEGETGSGGGSGSGGVGWWDTSGVAQLDYVVFSYTILDHNTGAELGNILQATRYSDIDASQKVSYGITGLQGIILSSDTELSLKNGFLEGPNNTTNDTDGSILGSKSLIKVSTNTTNAVKYDGLNQKSTIAAGIFGRTDINLDLTGTFKLDKSLIDYGDKMPNAHYSFLPITFDIFDKDGKDVGDIVVPANGAPVESKGLKEGEYTAKERPSSVTAPTGQILNTKEFKVSVKAGVRGDKAPVIKADNQVVKTQVELNKVDSDTETAVSTGKGDMSTAKYQLFYNEDSADHKKGQPVKWNDVPDKDIELVKGTKVESYYADGKLVNVGDNIVVDVDDENLSISLKGLLLNKYYLKEVDAPVGYAVDNKKIEFEAKWQDNATVNVTLPAIKAKEKPIKAKINFQKAVEIAGESAESGYNDIKFDFTPINGKGEVISATTGVGANGDDGYGNVTLDYNDYVMTEDPETAPEGYALIKPIYIHMDTDVEKDIVTISASWNADFSKPFSIRQFYQSDDSGVLNDSIKGSVGGTITDESPIISLTTLKVTDKETPPEIPSIDVEKSSEKIPQAGQGNNSDKNDNLGKGDADTKETAVKLDDKAQQINFRVTNNGSEILTHIKVTDKTIEGKQDVKDIKWTYQGKALTINQAGEFEVDGKLLELPIDYFIEATGTLDKLADGETHADEATVSAKGAISGKPVGDGDKWYGEEPKTPDTPTPENQTPNLPMTGETKAKFAGIVGLILIASVAFFVKRKSIVKLISRFK